MNRSGISLGSGLFTVCLVYSHSITPLLIKLSKEHRLAHRLTRKTYTTFLKELPISINHWSVNEVTGHLQGVFTYSFLAAHTATHIKIYLSRSPLIWVKQNKTNKKKNQHYVSMQIKYKVLPEFQQRTRGSQQQSTRWKPPWIWLMFSAATEAFQWKSREV